MVGQFLVFLCDTIMANSDKHNNLFCACAIGKFSEKSKNTKKNITQTSKGTAWWSFKRSFAGYLGNMIKLK